MQLPLLSSWPEFFGVIVGRCKLRSLFILGRRIQSNEWNEERLIDAPIDVVWALFEEEKAIRIMPKVVENRWLDKKTGTSGSTYEQTYQDKHGAAFVI